MLHALFVVSERWVLNLNLIFCAGFLPTLGKGKIKVSIIRQRVLKGDIIYVDSSSLYWLITPQVYSYI